MAWGVEDDDDGSLGRDAELALRRLGTLSGARLGRFAAMETSLRGTDYRGADLSSSDFMRCSMKRFDLRRADLRLATLDGVHLLGVDLRHANLTGASLRGACLSACDLRGADLRNADLRDANFGCWQQHNGWLGSTLDAAKLDGAMLAGVTFEPQTIWPKAFDAEAAGATPVASHRGTGRR